MLSGHDEPRRRASSSRSRGSTDRAGCSPSSSSTSTRCARSRCWSCWCGRSSRCRSSPASRCRRSGRRCSGSTVHLAAYAAEIVRAGIESVRPGQTRAALALGMSRAQIVRRIVLPQAIVRMLPAFGSLLSVTIKDTAIASVIAVPELMRQSETRRRAELPADRGLHVRDARLLRDAVPGHARRRPLYRRVAHLGRHREAHGSMTLRLDRRLAASRRARRGDRRRRSCSRSRRWRSPCRAASSWRCCGSTPGRRCARSATAYVELFRNLPLILVVYWAFYVLPILTGVGLSPLATGLAALALNVTAYNAETFRAGINSIRRGQIEAAMALGMSRTQALRRVVLPQALRRDPAGAREHLGVAVQGHVARLGHRGHRACLRRDADPRADASACSRC